MVMRSEIMVPRELAPPHAAGSAAPLSPKALVLPFRDLSGYRDPAKICVQFARGLGDSLRTYLDVVPVDSSLAHLSEQEEQGQLTGEKALELAWRLGASICVLAEIEDLSVTTFRASAPGAGRHRGTSAVKAYVINTVAGRLTGEVRGHAMIDSSQTAVPQGEESLRREYMLLREIPWDSEEFHRAMIGRAVGKSLQELARKVSEVARPPRVSGGASKD